MLMVGEKLWNGAVVSKSLATAYNAMTAEIEAFERSGREAPANLLNGRHNLIANVRRA